MPTTFLSSEFFRLCVNRKTNERFTSLLNVNKTFSLIHVSTNENRHTDLCTDDNEIWMISLSQDVNNNKTNTLFKRNISIL